MKRTYVDLVAEYYESRDDLLHEAFNLGMRAADMQRAFRLRKLSRKHKMEE